MALLLCTFEYIVNIFTYSMQKFSALLHSSIEGDQCDDRGQSQRRKELCKKLTGFLVETRVRQSKEVVSQSEKLSLKEKFRDNIYLKTVKN